MKKVTKAVIPAAGLGTRVLPATKAMPKGMLPIVDKPAIQYLVEEAVRSGITDILIILSRSQSIIEDHFDRSPELEAKLAAPGKEKMLEECLGISNLANIMFVRQHQTLGLGHAVSMAKAFTGDDPFVVIYGDDVIWGEDPVCAQLIRAYEEFGRPVAGVSAGCYVLTGLSEAVLGARANLVSSLVLLGVAIFLELIVLSVIRVRTGHGKKVVR